MSKIKIRIEPGGKVTMSPEGAPGGACRKLTAPFEKVFAGKVVSDVDTPEAREPEIVVEESADEQQQLGE